MLTTFVVNDHHLCVARSSLLVASQTSLWRIFRHKHAQTLRTNARTVSKLWLTLFIFDAVATP